MPIKTTRPTHLYRLFDHAGRLIYIGISTDPSKRLERHKSTQPWADEIARLQVGQVFEARDAAEEAEKIAIQRESPTYNKVHSFRPPTRNIFFTKPNAVCVVTDGGRVINGVAQRDNGEVLLIEHCDFMGYLTGFYSRVPWSEIREFIEGIRSSDGELMNNDQMVDFAKRWRHKQPQAVKEQA